MTGPLLAAGYIIVISFMVVVLMIRDLSWSSQLVIVAMAFVVTSTGALDTFVRGFPMAVEVVELILLAIGMCLVALAFVLEYTELGKNA